MLAQSRSDEPVLSSVRSATDTLAGMSVTHQSVTCPGPLLEERPGAGECARGEECEVLELRTDYLAYRSAHIRVTSLWREPKG
jgi:hypothetical protein